MSEFFYRNFYCIWFLFLNFVKKRNFEYISDRKIEFSTFCLLIFTLKNSTTSSKLMCICKNNFHVEAASTTFFWFFGNMHLYFGKSRKSEMIKTTCLSTINLKQLYFQHLACVLLLCQNKHKKMYKNVCLMYDENKSHVCHERLFVSENEIIFKLKHLCWTYKLGRSLFN